MGEDVHCLRVWGLKWSSFASGSHPILFAGYKSFLQPFGSVFLIAPLQAKTEEANKDRIGDPLTPVSCSCETSTRCSGIQGTKVGGGERFLWVSGNKVVHVWGEFKINNETN